MSAFGVKKGDRVKLIAMPEDPCPVPVGTMGTVTGWHVDTSAVTINGGLNQIFVEWDNGSHLNLLPGVDQWEVV